MIFLIVYFIIGLSITIDAIKEGVTMPKKWYVILCILWFPLLIICYIHDIFLRIIGFHNQTFFRATDNDDIEAIRKLLKYTFEDPSENNDYAIRMASQRGNAEIVRLLLVDKRINPNILDDYPCRIACRNGHTEVVKLLLQNDKVNPANNNNESIMWASANGYIDVVELLLKDKRVDPTAADNSTIVWALQSGFMNIVKLLLNEERIINAYCLDENINELLTFIKNKGKIYDNLSEEDKLYIKMKWDI